MAGDSSWADAVEFDFISGGGGAWYSRTLQLLSPGDRVWVNVPGAGYVGVGRVMGPAQPCSTFTVKTPQGDKPVLEVATRGNYHREFIDDPDKCEWFVPMRWLQTVPLAQAVHETGFFGIQHTVCRPAVPKWRTTVERLKQKFTDFDKP